MIMNQFHVQFCWGFDEGHAGRPPSGADHERVVLPETCETVRAEPTGNSRMTERGMRQEEQETGRRLRRALTGRRSFTLCFLTYADRKQRDRLSAHFAETLDANELVRLTPQDEPNTPALLKRMAGEPGTPPLQIQDIGSGPRSSKRWPTG